MFASRVVTVAGHHYNTGALRYNQLREDHTTVAVDMANVELSLVEGFAQRLEIAKGVGPSLGYLTVEQLQPGFCRIIQGNHSLFATCS